MKLSFLMLFLQCLFSSQPIQAEERDYAAEMMDRWADDPNADRSQSKREDPTFPDTGRDYAQEMMDRWADGPDTTKK